jgi:hypothetical protein
MSDAREQAARVISESDIPADATRENPAEPTTPTERMKRFAHAGLSRMRTEWPGADRDALIVLKAEADRLIREEFRGFFSIIDRFHRCVRTPQADGETGEVKAYDDGTPMWEMDEWGDPAEDWGSLDDRTRDGILHSLAIRLAEWEMHAADDWAEAMYAKVVWEEKFANGFVAMPGHQVSGKPTIEDRTYFGNRYSIDERYFAVFRSVVSRKADAIVKSATRLYYLLEKTTVR